MSAAFVLDASMAFAWVLPSQASTAAEALLKRVEEGDEVVVPPLWFLEALSLPQNGTPPTPKEQPASR